MKKLLLTLLLLVTLLFGGGYFLAFTQSGNDILKPFINSYLKQKVKGVNVKIDNFTLKSDHIEADATINNMAKINLNSSFDISKKSFDAIYTIRADKINAGDIKVNEKVYIKGKAVGDIKKALIFGVGKVASSDIEYQLQLVDTKPQNIVAKIDRANLSKLLSLAGQKPYASGVVNLVANIPSLEEKNLKGSANLSISGGKINSKLLAKDFKIVLPKDTTFDLNTNASLSGDNISVKNKLISTLANLITKDLKYNLKKKSLVSDYTLDIANLAKLSSLAKMKLRGNFSANGKVILKNQELTATASSKSFGGKCDIVYSNDKATILLNKVKTKSILYKLFQPLYSDGLLNGNIKLDSIKNLNGNFDIQANGVSLKNDLKKAKIYLAQDIKYSLLLKGNIKNKKVSTNLNLDSNIAKINLKNAKYNIKNNDFESIFSVNIDDLATVSAFVHQKLRGSFKTIGQVSFIDKKLNLATSTPSFGGKTKVIIKGDKLTATLQKAKTSLLFYKLNLPKYTDASVDGNINLSSIKNLTGKFKINGDGVNSRSDLKKLYDFDSDRNIKYHLTSNGTLKNKKVFALADLKNSFGDIKLKNIAYDINKGAFSSLYEIFVDNLAKLNYITKQKLVGDLKVNGKISKAKDLIITGHANKFNGTEEFKLVNNSLVAHVKGAKLTDIQKTLSYPLMLEARANASLTYNLKSSNGLVNVVMNKAKMLPNKLTRIIKGIGGTDLSAEHYNDTKLDARLSKNLIDFNFLAKSKSVVLSIKDGKIYQPAGKLDALLEAKMGKNNLKLKIRGTTNDPKIRLDTSAIRDNLKAKAKERLKEKLNLKKEELKQKLENKVQDKLKNQLNDKLKNELKNGLLKKLF